jgi:hypothetical protein
MTVCSGPYISPALAVLPAQARSAQPHRSGYAVDVVVKREQAVATALASH